MQRYSFSYRSPWISLVAKDFIREIAILNNDENDLSPRVSRSVGPLFDLESQKSCSFHEAEIAFSVHLSISEMPEAVSFY